MSKPADMKTLIDLYKWLEKEYASQSIKAQDQAEEILGLRREMVSTQATACHWRNEYLDSSLNAVALCADITSMSLKIQELEHDREAYLAQYERDQKRIKELEAVRNAYQEQEERDRAGN